MRHKGSEWRSKQLILHIRKFHILRFNLPEIRNIQEKKNSVTVQKVKLESAMAANYLYII